MMETLLAVALAIGASILTNYAIYLQKKAVVELPEVKARLSWRVIWAFITDIPWLLAQATNVAGFILYMIALSFAPVSVVEPIVASGVALLAYLAIKNLGEKPRRMDYYAIGMNVFGVILLGVSLAEGLPPDSLHDPYELWVFTVAAVALAVFVPLFLRRGGRKSESVGLGISTGLFFGIAAVFSRLLMGNFGGQWYIWIVACLFTYLPGFIILQAALQRGMAVIVAPVYNGLMEFVPILVGMVALNERLPESFALSVVRLVSFALILIGTVILSRRAEEGGQEDGGGGPG